jgi:outer membrane protein TolC
LDAARRWAETCRDELLPELQKSLNATERLYNAGDPGVDALRVLDFRRKLLKARDAYLDALWEVSQARADIAAAVGDPTVALTGLEVPEGPQAQTPPPPSQ